MFRVTSKEHVRNADNVRTTIAALLQCEDLPDRLGFTPLPRIEGAKLDNDGIVTGQILGTFGPGTAREPLATIRKTQTVRKLIGLPTFTQF